MTGKGPPPESPGGNGVHRRGLFKILVPRLHSADPSLILPLLASGNRTLHEEALAALYEKVTILIPTDISSAQLQLPVDRRADSILAHPRLAASVRTLRFVHSQDRSWSSSTQSFRSSSSDRGRSSTGNEGSPPDPRPPIWDMVTNLVRSCTHLTTIEWTLGIGINRAVWEAIGSCASGTLRQLRVTHPAIHPAQVPTQSVNYPRITPQRQLRLGQPDMTLDRGPVAGDVPPVSGVWTLGSGWEQLEVLELGPLSETGAKVIATHFTSLTSSSIHTLRIETHFLDTLLCGSIGSLGSLGVLTHLTLSTSGVKFNDGHLRQIVEGCRNLESLSLYDVEGHLSKDVWATVEEWPESFQSLDVTIKEYTKHKTWAVNHLKSIHALPFGQLRRLVVRRELHPVELPPFPPRGALSAPPTAGMQPKAIPDAVLDAIREGGKHLAHLCLDWWEMKGKDVLVILEHCPKLACLEVALSASVTSFIGTLPKMTPPPPIERLVISSDPGKHPCTQSSKGKLSSLDETLGLPSPLLAKVHEYDANLPESKDLRKFVSRLPRMRRLLWTGRGGRGEWHFTKKSTKSNSVAVDFTHSAMITREIYQQCQLPSPNFSFREIVEQPRSPVFQPTEPLPLSALSTPSLAQSSLSRSTTVDSTSIRTPQSPAATVDASTAPDPADQAVLSDEPKCPSRPAPTMARRTPPSVRISPRRTSGSRSRAPTSPAKPAAQSAPSTQVQVGRKNVDPKSAHRQSWSTTTSTFTSAPNKSTLPPKYIPGSGGRRYSEAKAKNAGRRAQEADKDKGGQGKGRRGIERAEDEGRTRDARANPEGWTVVGGQNKGQQRSV